MLSMRHQLEIVSNRLLDRGWQLTTAESCTGGGIAEMITRLPGSSGWFCGGIVSYSNELKISLLGVSKRILSEAGAVSEPVVLQMVTGVLDITRADLAVAVSGIAGPGGGSPDKPVGTVWCGWGLRGTLPSAECCHFAGSRQQVRDQTIRHAVAGLSKLTQTAEAAGN